MFDKLDKEIIFSHIFGTTEYEMVLVGFLFALLGVLLSFLMEFKERIFKENPEAKARKFWQVVLENVTRLFITIIIIAIAMRFSDKFIGMEYSVYAAFIIGFASDKISQNLKSIRQNIV